MNLHLMSAIGAAAFALLTAVILLPLAKQIQSYLECKLRSEEGELGESDPYTASKFEFSGLPAFLICAIGAVLAYISLSAFGMNVMGLATCVYFFVLLLLAVINLKSYLLPDLIVAPSIVIALLFHVWHGNPLDHLYGAIAGYASLYLLMLILMILLRIEAIGRGDMKVLALAGAWFGLAAMPVVWIVFVGISVIHVLFGRMLTQARYVATGPTHLVASLAFLAYEYLF